MRSGVAHGRRFFRSTLQPIAEHLEYNPASIAARYRSTYLGSISLPAVQQASYSTSQSDKPTRETGDDKLDDVPANQNTVPAKGSLDKQGGGKAMKGHDSPTREELESQGSSGAGSSGDSAGGTSPTGKTDSHKSPEEGTSRNAKPGEFAPSDPKKPESNTPENSREKSGQ
ncbi:g2436 [Coccomyxa viridis]|uniref:G2436 protein n=1 Tax=Coccomyxa viridis TaxID=1274662 RepID=A0ABP1FQL4_9CHLO